MGFFFLTHFSLFLTFSWRTNCDTPPPSFPAPLHLSVLRWGGQQSRALDPVRLQGTQEQKPHSARSAPALGWPGRPRCNHPDTHSLPHSDFLISSWPGCLCFSPVSQTHPKYPNSSCSARLSLLQVSAVGKQLEHRHLALSARCLKGGNDKCKRHLRNATAAHAGLWARHKIPTPEVQTWMF